MKHIRDKIYNKYKEIRAENIKLNSEEYFTELTNLLNKSVNLYGNDKNSDDFKTMLKAFAQIITGENQDLFEIHHSLNLTQEALNILKLLMVITHITTDISWERSWVENGVMKDVNIDKIIEDNFPEINPMLKQYANVAYEGWQDNALELNELQIATLITKYKATEETFNLYCKDLELFEACCSEGLFSWLTVKNLIPEPIFNEVIKNLAPKYGYYPALEDNAITQHFCYSKLNENALKQELENPIVINAYVDHLENKKEHGNFESQVKTVNADQTIAKLDVDGKVLKELTKRQNPLTAGGLDYIVECLKNGNALPQELTQRLQTKESVAMIIKSYDAVVKVLSNYLLCQPEKINYIDNDQLINGYCNQNTIIQLFEKDNQYKSAAKVVWDKYSLEDKYSALSTFLLYSTTEIKNPTIEKTMYDKKIATHYINENIKTKPYIRFGLNSENNNNKIIKDMFIDLVNETPELMLAIKPQFMQSLKVDGDTKLNSMLELLNVRFIESTIGKKQHERE